MSSFKETMDFQLLVLLKIVKDLKQVQKSLKHLPPVVNRRLVGLLKFRNLLRKSRCDDCNRRGPGALFKRANGCADIHTGWGICCIKYICRRGCRLNCINCKTVNCYSSYNNDGYGEYVVCWCCEEWNAIKVYFNGSLETNCERYCEMGCFEDSEWLLEGSEKTKELEYY